MFLGADTVLRSRSFAGDLISAAITLSIVLFSVASTEIVYRKKFSPWAVVWGFNVTAGFIFALLGNFLVLPRLFHSPTTPATTLHIFLDEIESGRGILIVGFTILCSFFSSLHGRLPKKRKDEGGEPPLKLFRQPTPSK